MPVWDNTEWEEDQKDWEPSKLCVVCGERIYRGDTPCGEGRDCPLWDEQQDSEEE